MAAIHYRLISVTFLRFFEALQSANRNLSTRIGMFFAGLFFLDLKSSFSKVKTNKMMGLMSVQWTIYR